MTSFFCLVNLDDELYEAEGGGGGSSSSANELGFDEFIEIIIRVCNESVRGENE